jgi:hypothetical protein
MFDDLGQETLAAVSMTEAISCQVWRPYRVNKLNVRQLLRSAIHSAVLSG